MSMNTSGLLLLFIGIAGLAGFLTGNLDRWLGYLFDPGRPPLGATPKTGGTAPAPAPQPGLVSIASTSQRAVA